MHQNKEVFRYFDPALMVKILLCRSQESNNKFSIIFSSSMGSWLSYQMLLF